MYNLRAQEIAKAVRGEIISGDPNVRANGIVTDSRGTCAGTLFAAFVGENTDGHDHLNEAFQKGASAALITNEEAARLAAANNSPRVALIKVRDMLKAVQALARYQREILDPECFVVGITGSTGKTSVKEFVAAALSSGMDKVVATKENQNNELGAALTVLRVKEDTKALVVEMGMRGAGQIKELGEIVAPHAAIIANTGSAHLEILGDVESIARAKAEIFETLTPFSRELFGYAEKNNFAIAPLNDNHRSLLESLSPVRLSSAGFDCSQEMPADICISKVEVDDAGRAYGKLSGFHSLPEGVELKLSIPGKHHLLNAAYALALTEALGLDVLAAAKALEGLEAKLMRFEFQELKGGKITVINDAYNANPDSMRGALETFKEIKAQGRKILVLGDMLELGESGPFFHEEIGKLAAKTGADLIYLVGNFSMSYEKGIRCGSQVATTSFELANIEGLINSLKTKLQDGDLILFKASRSLQLEDVIKRLEDYFAV